ncbi:META domain-containing protein [Flavobacterium reichenbachii]|uniref:Heat-shock protein n=1 Tax=Flavobacterium reichenbachii TaxID=362418 RepID=A0A085ZM74_9FLAO|nr:META domain-containing protein [Flavobacterium reichenbachii]KFF05538.1 heat-shock protein [Flavobacterium reichenbachii]OXB17873.1 heat-shock protein [Flavobacterium reichenbachii]
MKKIFLLLLLLSLMVSCKTAAGKSSDTKQSVSVTEQEDDMNYYFKANGNEPFWGIKIGKDKTVFTSLIKGMESLTFDSVTAIPAMDANVKMYNLSNDKASATVTIQQLDCQDSMSGAVSPYSAKVEIKNNSDLQPKKLAGCGKYITDYRLHDIWVLEELNGFKVFVTDFQKEFPRIEINAAENQFSGFGGCNSITGQIFFEKDILRFTKVVSTLMACAPGNKESEFLKTLQSSTTYSIENNRLTLSNPSGKLIVFKKVD